jgi:integrase
VICTERSQPFWRTQRDAGGPCWASELRGLRWSDVDLKAKMLHVRQRADRFNTIGAPKSEAGKRKIPFGPTVANTLREWKLQCPQGELDLVFPNGAGNIEMISNIIQRGWHPAQIAAGVRGLSQQYCCR